MQKADDNRIVILGKGGVGKSTFAANLSAHYAREGSKVLHVGCDPKGDSSLLLLEDLVNYRTVITMLAQLKDEPSQIINRGRLGIDCIEVGGPESGVGCGGRGIARALEFIENARIIDKGGYDVVIFDVLGDVVCGGFAAPMREGFGNKVLIVASEDEQSFYAANNIARAVVRYSINGVGLVGLVVNRKGEGDPGLTAADFGARIDTGVVGELPYCNAMAAARLKRLTMVESDPLDEYSVSLSEIARHIADTDVSTLPLPTPMDPVSFFKFATGAGVLSALPSEAQAVAAEASSATRADTVVASKSDVLGEKRGVLMAGPGAVARFSSAMGFDRKALRGLKARLRTVHARDDDSVWLAIESPLFGAWELILRPLSEEGAFAAGENLEVAYRGQELTPVVQELLRLAAKRLGRYTPDELRAVILADKESAASVRPSDRAVQETDSDSSGGAGFVGDETSYRCGPEGIERFEGWLKLEDGGPGEAELQSVDAKADGSVWLEVGLPGSLAPMVVILQPPGRGGAFIRGAKLDVAYQGEELTPELETLLNYVVERLGKRKAAALHKVVMDDPGRTKMGLPPDDTALTLKESVDDWFNFFADDQFRRNAFHAFEMDARYVSIEHCDMECHFATPIIADNQFDFYNYPWLESGTAPSSRHVERSDLVEHYRTRLDEADVISGSTDKLRRLLGGVVGDLDDQQIIMVNNACTPIIAGDDVESLLKAMRRRCPVPIMLLGPDGGTHPFLQFFLRMKESTGFSKSEVDPTAVNLVGFPATRDADDLTVLLERMGARVNCRPFPRIEMSIFDDYLAAAAQVFLPNAFYTEIYDKLFGDVDVPALSPPAPYGMAATGAWLEAVGKALRKGKRARRVVEEARSSMAPDWEMLAQQAQALTLGFVVSKRSAARLADPELNYGVPILPLLQEMGFAYHILAYAPEDGDEELLKSTLQGAGQNAVDVVRTFSSVEELHRMLRDSPARSFYSDYYFDHRLSAAGKSQFSLQFFELGFEGALRTFRRLIAAAKVPFFKKYARYLGGGGP